MKELHLKTPELILIAATRAVLGAGVGLLAGTRIARQRSKVIGLVLLGIGALSTIPIALVVRRHQRVMVS